MKLVTDAMIAAKASELNTADRELVAQRAGLAAGVRGAGGSLPEQYTRARDDADMARAELEKLRRDRESQAKALEARSERERVASAELAKLVKELESSREQLRARVGAGDTLGAIQAAQEHDRVVVKVRDRLVTIGLRLGDVAEDVDHGTGADDPHQGLRLRGRYWFRVDGGGLANWMHARVMAAAFGRFNHAAQSAHGLPGVGSIERRTDGLLDGVPELPSLALDRPRRRPATPPRVADRPPPEEALAPYLIREARKGPQPFPPTPPPEEAA